MATLWVLVCGAVFVIVFMASTWGGAKLLRW